MRGMMRVSFRVTDSFRRVPALLPISRMRMHHMLTTTLGKKNTPTFVHPIK